MSGLLILLQRKRKLSDLKSTLEQSEKKKAATKKLIVKATVGKEDTVSVHPNEKYKNYSNMFLVNITSASMSYFLELI